jgi:hypothetical protein
MTLKAACRVVLPLKIARSMKRLATAVVGDIVVGAGFRLIIVDRWFLFESGLTKV